MVGFRNIAVHEYQRLQLAATGHVITQRLDDFISTASCGLAKIYDTAPIGLIIHYFVIH